jgi:hypothetical protein
VPQGINGDESGRIEVEKLSSCFKGTEKKSKEWTFLLKKRVSG